VKDFLYHPHQLKDPDVKYYNPRKGLETIDGLKYNSLPQTNSLLKEIQYEFNFNFFSSVLKFTRHRKRTPRIKLASVFDINEMEKLTKDFNENKDYRHQRKIKYKKYKLKIFYSNKISLLIILFFKTKFFQSRNLSPKQI